MHHNACDIWKPAKGLKLQSRPITFHQANKDQASFTLNCFSLNQAGIFTTNAENPKSSVMPLSLLWGFLSKPAVDAIVLSALHKEVLPLSMCPNTPILMLMMFEG